MVFLDAVEMKYIDELGGMNIFFVYDDGRLVTPPLTGTILPGITRDSVITLAREQGRTACGTAAVITPIGTVRFTGGEFTMPNNGHGEVASALRQSLVDIQRGRTPDTHDWVHRVL